jgi:hypothetical protein
MDPQVARDQLLCAYSEGGWETLETRATDLLAWLGLGGFPPKISAKPVLGTDWGPSLRSGRVPLCLETAPRRGTQP